MKTGKRIASLLLVGAFALTAFTACQSDAGTNSSTSAEPTLIPTDSVAVVDTSSVTIVTGETAAADTSAADTTVAATEAQTVSVALAENKEPHAVAADTADAAATTSIVLNGDSITVDGSGVTVDGSTATITAAGVYDISGTLADGQIVVDTEDDGEVRLVLDGVDISNASSAPVNILSADETVIVLADGTDNYLSDGATYVYADPEEDEPNAALFSKDDLTITGNGSLTVDGNYNDGITSKDGLVIASGNITVNAVDDGIRGKDYLVIEAGNITVNSGGDGLKSDEDEDAAKGYIAIESGVINVTAGGDAITAETDVLISDGQFTLTTAGGSNAAIDEDLSAKGIKAGVSVTIDGGTFNVDAADDAIHSNDSMTINNGDFNLATGDDGMHADTSLTINDGKIVVTRSYEGIESALITINAGDISLVSSDDGINVADGNDGSGMGPGMGTQPGGRQRPGGGTPPGGTPGQQTFTYTGSNYLYINGGVIVVEAAGDGIDVNGAIEMTGGLVIVNGPTANNNGALDYDGGFKISGGTLVAAGSAGMAQAPDASSSQNSLMLTFPSALPAGTLINIQTADGESLMTFAPLKTFQSIVFSSPDLQTGDTVVVYYGGSTTGDTLGGLTIDGTYTPGEQIASVTISNVVTTIR